MIRYLFVLALNLHIEIIINAIGIGIVHNIGHHFLDYQIDLIQHMLHRGHLPSMDYGIHDINGLALNGLEMQMGHRDC